MDQKGKEQVPTISKHSTAQKDGLFVDKGMKGTQMGSKMGKPA